MLLILALSGAPVVVLLATVLAALPVGPLVACYLWLDRYEPEPRRLLALGLLWGGFVATAARSSCRASAAASSASPTSVSLAVVAPVTEEAGKGLFLLLLLWWRRDELDGDPRRHRLRRHGRHRLRLHREHPLPRRGLQRHRRHGPRRHRRRDHDLRDALPVQPVRPPAVHRVHRHRRRHRGRRRAAARVRFLAPLGGYCSPCVAHALWNGSTLYGFAGFVGVYVVLMVPAFVGLVCARRLGPPLRSGGC